MTFTANQTWATLDNLADELLLDILDYISIRGRYDIDFKTWDGDAEIESRVKTLHSLSLVSRKLHRVTNPLLYSVLTHGGVARCRRKFLRTAILKPELAALVKEVRFSYFDWDADHSGVSSDYSDFMETANSLDFSLEVQDQSFRASLEVGFNDADVALLFSQLPNLEILEFGVDETWSYTWQWLLRLVGASAKKGAGPFSSLRHLKARYGNENESGFNPLFIQDWANLSSLRTIEISGAWCDERDGGRPLSLPSNSNIRTLAVRKSGLSADFIRAALEASSGLTTFVYDWKKYATCSSEDYPDGIRRALSSRQDTLEKIHLLMLANGTDYCFGALRRGMYLAPFGSFKNFAQLKCLEVSDFLLTGGAYLGFAIPVSEAERTISAAADVFPPSLEVLRIGSQKSRESRTAALHRVRCFEELIRHVASLPNFRRLELLPHGEIEEEEDPIAYEVYYESISRMIELGHKSSVSFKVISLEEWKQVAPGFAESC